MVTRQDFQPIFTKQYEPKIAKYFVLPNGQFPNAHKIIPRRVYILERDGLIHSKANENIGENLHVIHSNAI
jgi:hypothetical protein